MRKKVFLLFMITLLLCGCSASYSITINDDNTISEEVSISEKKVVLNSDIGSFGDYDSEYFVNIYLKDQEKTWTDKYKLTNYYRSDSDKYYIVKKDAKYSSINELKKSEILNTIFNNVNITNVGDIWSINLSGFNNDVLNLVDKYDVVINLPYLVMDTNGSIDNSNNVSWNFTNEDVSNISIEFDISKNYQEVTIVDEIESETNYKLIIIIVVCIVSLGLIGFVIFKTMYKLNDDV